MQYSSGFWRAILLMYTLCTPIPLISSGTDLQEPTDIQELELLIETYFQQRDEEPQKALRTIRKAARLANRTFSDRSTLSESQRKLWQQAEGYLALSQFDRGRFLESEEHWVKTHAIHDTILDTNLRNELKTRRILLDSALMEVKFPETKEWLRNLKPGKKVADQFSRGTQQVQANMEQRMFTSAVRKGNINSALKHYNKASDLLDELGDEAGLQELETQYQTWLAQMDSTLIVNHIKEEAVLEPQKEEVVLEPLENERLETLKAEAQAIENSGLSTEQATLFERYKSLQKAIAEEEKRNALALQDKENQIQNQELEIRVLLQEKDISKLSLQQQRLIGEEEARKKRNLMIVLALVFALLLSVFILYRHKIRANRQLNQAKNELAVVNAKVAGLLQEQLSADIADTLIKGESIAVKEAFVAVMFVDIRGFTPIVAQLKPEEINHYQNAIFGFMIDIIESHNGNINQLLGDGFMATFGAPKSFGNDVQNAVDAGIQILKELAEINRLGKIPQTEIGIGIDCGVAVMGNVGGSGRKQFSITGNVVISAARIEQVNKTIGSHYLISEEVKQKVNLEVACKEHQMALKGRQGLRALYQLLPLEEAALPS
ncbi:adenylate/guanylate cyclase domain-containing protein [Ulvibacterium sp.]|uniref:adenylate/guanylate cyclase domain-containing protein n=1 Tax=Ulvibacterium sp. TaxID=2665914 RepID=UPI00263811A5|nr:adenylate/guanylate cyclase domain-containing protein [Ulvibacterium sp.]